MLQVSRAVRVERRTEQEIVRSKKQDENAGVAEGIRGKRERV